MNFWKMMGTVSVIAVAVSVAAAQDAQTPTDLCAAAATDEPATREYTQAEDVLEAGVDYRAIFCTEAGAIYVDLFEKIAPVTVNNFVFLAEEGYYNNTTFHRVLQDFMVQGGDPTGTGSGGPGYQFEDETPGFVTFNREGLLAMANAGAGTNGSQFFITTSIPDYLNYKHTIFGDVLEGYDTLTSITLRDPSASPAPTTPGDALKTVIIVTDPTTVTTTFAEEVTAATQEELIAALTTAIAPETLPTDLTTEGVLVQTLDDVVATVPDTVQGAYRDSLEANNFEYRLAVEVSQTGCNDQYGFDLLGYRVDAFASAADASAFLTTDVLTTINTERGYEAVTAPMGTVAFKTAAPLCNEAAGSVEQISVQRGRYIATIYGQFSDDIIANVPVSSLLVNSIGTIFESTLVDAYRGELR